MPGQTIAATVLAVSLAHWRAQMSEPQLTVDGDVESPTVFSFSALRALPETSQVRDVSRLHPKRQGDAVRLAGLLDLVRPKAGVRYLTLHASADDFHACIPLEAVRDTSILIYSLDGAPLPLQAGGPLRFFIPNHTACHTSEIDECANVKFVDRIELSTEMRFDNRPHDQQQHAELHEREAK
jgi:DMSO/TMAO reductase YedYZ molybdopterin-dependent catalytic subunit